MSSRTSSFAGMSALAALLLAGCGGIASPDLSTGQVSGRLIGTQPGAFVYAFGAPETKAAVAADGSYTLKGVPVTSTGKVQVVLFDGADHADFLEAEVSPASRTRADDRDSKDLQKARRITVSVVCGGNVSCQKAEYVVDGAVLANDPSGDAATLFPLPPGVFTVRAKMSGFSAVPKDVDVRGGDFSGLLPIEMDVDDKDTAHRGCLSNPCADSPTGSPLHCNDSDGRCYQCNVNADCGVGQKCSGGHSCEAGG